MTYWRIGCDDYARRCGVRSGYRRRRIRLPGRIRKPVTQAQKRLNYWRLRSKSGYPCLRVRSNSAAKRVVAIPPIGRMPT